jgi:MFS family permease
MAFMVGVGNLANTAAFAVFPVFAVDPGPLGLSEGGFGLFLTASAVGALAGSTLAPIIEKAVGRARALQLSTIGMAVGLCGPVFFTTVVPNAVVLVSSGVFVIVWNVITVSLRQRIVPEHLMGRVNAGYRLLAWGTMPVGAAAGGIVAETFGIRTVFAAGAIAQLALLVCFIVLTDTAIDEAERAGEPASEPQPA